jgi:hypothetical protein
LEPRIVKFFNSFFYVVKKKTGADSYIGLISIKNRYPYENDFLQSGFNPVFRLPKGSVLEFTPGKGYDVTDTDGAFLFSIIIPPGTDTSNPRITIGLIICFAGFVLLAIFLFRYIGRRKTALSKFLTGLLLLVYLFHSEFYCLFLVSNHRGCRCLILSCLPIRLLCQAWATCFSIRFLSSI